MGAIWGRGHLGTYIFGAIWGRTFFGSHVPIFHITKKKIFALAKTLRNFTLCILNFEFAPHLGASQQHMCSPVFARCDTDIFLESSVEICHRIETAVKCNCHYVEIGGAEKIPRSFKSRIGNILS